MSKIQLIYQLDDIDAEDGVDIFEIAPILMQFGALITSANDVLCLDQKIDVRVKPFREGSWITEFLIHSSITASLLNYLKTPEGQALASLLSLLGFSVTGGIVGVAKIIRFTKGKVANFKKDDAGTFTYENEEGEKLTVSLEEHRLVQSPLIQKNYYGCVIKPLEIFPDASGVTIKQDDKPQERFTSEDIPAFTEYAKSTLAEEIEENVSTMHGVYLKPRRGSYSGDEKQYSFIMGKDNVLWPVSIEDDEFLRQLKEGDVRLYWGDLLKVDIEIRQKRDSQNSLRAHYYITKVIEYKKCGSPKQLPLDDEDELWQE